MRVTYKLTVDEYIAAQHIALRKTTVELMSIALAYFILPLVGLLLLLSAFSIVHQRGVSPSSVSGFFVPLIIMLFPLWQYLRLRYRFKASRIGDGTLIIQFEEDIIRTEVPGYEISTVEWAAIKRYREGKKILLVYISGISFVIVPKRAFGEGEYLELIALLKRKLYSRVA